MSGSGGSPSGDAKGGGSGAGGSIRVEGQAISITGSVQAISGPSTYGGPLGGVGRIALYYQNSFSGSFTPDYLVQTGPGYIDPVFSDSFESGDLTGWSSSMIDSGNLLAASAAAYWGNDGMQVIINDNYDQYVEDDSPNAEPHYRARLLRLT